MSDGWREIITGLIDIAIKSNAKEASATFSKCKDIDGDFKGWDVRITVGLPGTLDDDERDEVQGE